MAIDKTPDLYATNYGVEVSRDGRYPQHGQVAVRIKHNTFQSSLHQIGLEQAEELHSKLGALIEQIKSEVAE